MTLEQPAGLNKHIFDTIPFTWAVRWKLIKGVLPLTIPLCLLICERPLLTLWLSRPEGHIFPEYLANFIVVPGLLFALIEVMFRAEHWSKRVLKLSEKGITIHSMNSFCISYDRVESWRIEPAPQEPGLKKLILKHRRDKKGRNLHSWSMILEHPNQTHQLCSELEHLRQVGKNVAPLTMADMPAPPAMPISLQGMWQLIVAVILFCHAAALVCCAFLPDHQVIQEMISPHFSSLEQFRTFCGVTGGGALVFGAGFYVWGQKTLSKIKKETSPA